MSKVEIRKLLRDGVLVIGTDVVLKGLKKGHITKVFVAKNCAQDTLEELDYCQKLATFEVEKTDMTNEELGVLCKKPFSISVIGVVKKG